MANKDTNLEKVQMRSTRRKFRRAMANGLQDRYDELMASNKSALTKAMAAAGSKAQFKDKDQAVAVILSAEFGADVYERFDLKVLNPPAKEEKPKAEKKTPAGKKAKAGKAEPIKGAQKVNRRKPAAEEVILDETDETDEEEWEDDETE